MTIKEVATQVYSLAVDHQINGREVTKQWLESYIRTMMRNEDRLAIPGTLVMEIALRDGNWLFEVFRYADAPDGFDYDIPDSREDEDRIAERLFA